MQFAQKHIDLVNSGKPIKFGNDSTRFMVCVDEFNQATRHCKHLHLKYKSTESVIEFLYWKDNNLLFITTCALQRVFAGWCTMFMDFGHDGKTMLWKNCESRLEVDYTIGILRSLPILTKFPGDYMKFERCLVQDGKHGLTMNIPTRMLSKLYAVGIM